MIPLFLDNLVHLKMIEVIDILLVSILLYQFYRLIKGTGALNIFLGIIAIYILWKVVKTLHLELLSEILGAFISVGFLALIVVFQPEIRRFLFLLGTPNFITKKPKRFFFWRIRLANPVQLDIHTVLDACQNMAATKTGALIVIARVNELKQVRLSGVELDAALNSTLMENIFFKNSPLHDGAMIIHENRIRAARCILPVSERTDLPPEMGMRHRSAIGITEVTDAVAIVVSEQSGQISCCIHGEIRQDIEIQDLITLLETEVLVKD